MKLTLEFNFWRDSIQTWSATLSVLSLFLMKKVFLARGRMKRFLLPLCWMLTSSRKKERKKERKSRYRGIKFDWERRGIVIRCSLMKMTIMFLSSDVMESFFPWGAFSLFCPQRFFFTVNSFHNCSLIYVCSLQQIWQSSNGILSTNREDHVKHS